MALTNNGRATRMHRDSNPGDIDRQEGPTVLAGKDATGLDRLPVPAIEPKDPVGFRDRIPAFDVGQLAAMGLTRPDMAVIEVARSACTCLAEKPIAVSSRSEPVLGLRGQRRRFPPPV